MNAYTYVFYLRHKALLLLYKLILLVTDSIPVKWALQEGYEKVVVVLTRDKKYRKPTTSNKMKKLYKIAYHKYPKLINKLNTMPERYNKLQDELNDLIKLISDRYMINSNFPSCYSERKCLLLMVFLLKA